MSSAARKVCGHCGGSEFYSKGPGGLGYAAEWLRLRLGIFRWVDCRARVCGGCGLVQWFMTPESLEQVKEEFVREG